MTFTIEQIRKYILSKDSLGDVLYFLSEDAILKANEVTKVKIVEQLEEDFYYYNFEFEDGTIQEDIAASYEGAEELAEEFGYTVVDNF